MSVGLPGLVFVVLLILKVAEVGVVATWSWWLIFLPLIIGFLWTVLMIIFLLLVD